MTDLTNLISALQEIAAEISNVRAEIRSAKIEIRRGLNAANLGSKDDSHSATPESEQTREEWLKEAAFRSSKKLFKET